MCLSLLVCGLLEVSNDLFLVPYRPREELLWRAVRTSFKSNDSLYLLSKYTRVNTALAGFIALPFGVEQSQQSHEEAKYTIQTGQLLLGVVLLVCDLL